MNFSRTRWHPTTPNSVCLHTSTKIPSPRRSRTPQHGHRFASAGECRRFPLPLWRLEEGEVRREAEGGAHLAVSVAVSIPAGFLGRGAAARRGGVEDEVAGESEQREEELVQHRGGSVPPAAGVSLGFPLREIARREWWGIVGEEKRRKRAGTAEFSSFPWIFEKL